MISFRRAERSDLCEIVKIHLEAFPGFFLSMLGHKFLYDLYKSYLTDGNCIFIVAENSGFIQGFSAGIFNLRRRSLLSKLKLFIILSTRVFDSFLKNPIQIGGMMFPRITFFKRDYLINKNSVILRSIAVRSSAKGGGIAVSLLCEFECQCRLLDAHYIFLTTDAIGNSRAIHFYEKCGYSVFSAFNQGRQRKMLLMRKVLTHLLLD
jgi:ribosomal protein S18 acetylase RimI-like enzyme